MLLSEAWPETVLRCTVIPAAQIAAYIGASAVLSVALKPQAAVSIIICSIPKTLSNVGVAVP